MVYTDMSITRCTKALYKNKVIYLLYIAKAG